MKLITKCLVIALVLVVCFELFSFISSKAELLLFNDPPQYKTATYGNLWRDEKRPWGAWHKLNSADQHSRTCFDVTYQSNDVGARDDRDYRTLKQRDNIAVIGDSFVEGVGVRLERIFTYRLREKYGKRGLNFGAAGNFGPVQQYLIYQRLVKALPHNEIVYFFMPANDFVDNSDQYMNLYDNRYRPYFSKNDGGDGYRIIYPPTAVPSASFPSSGSAAAGPESVLHSIKMMLIGYTWSANAIRTIAHLDRFIRYMPSNKVSNVNAGYFTEDDYSVDGALHFVDKLFDSVPKAYKKTIFVIPRKIDLKQILSRGWSYKQMRWYEQLTAIARKYDAQFIDLALDRANSESRDYIDQGIDSWFLKCDWHWNEAGYDLALNRFLDSNSQANGKAQ